MALLPATEEALIERFGPHAVHEPPGGFAARPAAERLVKTHCCFCGVQCGIQLAVAGGRVVGFEPWEEFPVNRGKLCPKGVARYLQNGHPDRLLHPLVREPGGFRAAGWEEAMARVAGGIRDVQARHGRDAFAVLGGASLTNEKAYLLGKLARIGIGTANVDYNGRMCMVAAGAANKLAFGIDRAANPWSDIPETKLVFLVGTNVGACFPVLTDAIWRARDAGAKVVVVDPRLTPIARTADLFLPVRPGRDAALLNGILAEVIRRGGVDEAFVAAHTTGFEAVRAAVAAYDLERTETLTGVPAAAIARAAELWCRAPSSLLLHARGLEHHSHGVDNVLAAINLVLATGRIGKPGSGYGTITGQGNGQGGREHGQRCNQLPGGRDVENPADRAHVARMWGVPEAELPRAGLTAVELFEAIERGEVKGLLSISMNPLVSIPDSDRTRRALEKLELFVVIDFFLSETARHADVVLAGSLQEEDEGTVTTGEGRVVRLRRSVEPPGEARVDWEILVDLARRLGRGAYFPYEKAEDVFRELCEVSRGGVVDYGGITYERIEREMGVFWPCPTPGHPGTPRLFEGGAFAHPDGRARFHAIEYRPPAEDTDDEYPVVLTTGRVVSQYLSGNQTRRIGPLLEQQPEPFVEIHPSLARSLGIADGGFARVVSRRGEIVLRAAVTRAIRPDTVFVPYHWAGALSVNRITHRALDPVAKIPEFKVSAVRLEAA